MRRDTANIGQLRAFVARGRDRQRDGRGGARTRRQAAVSVGEVTRAVEERWRHRAVRAPPQRPAWSPTASASSPHASAVRAQRWGSGGHQPRADGQAAGARRGARRRHLIVVGDRRVLEDGAGSPRSRSTSSRRRRGAAARRTGRARCSSTSAISTRPPSARGEVSPSRRPVRQGELSLGPGAGQGGRRPRRRLHALQQGRHAAGRSPTTTTRSRSPPTPSASPARRASSTCWTACGTRA